MPLQALEDVTLHYEVAGAGPPVVLINALTMDAAGWRTEVQALATRYTVLTYDCRGQGRSGKPDQDYSIEAHADDLHRLVITLGFRRLHVVGLSLGGMIAQAFAAKYPAQTAGLVLASTTAHVEPMLERFLTAWIRVLEVGGGELAFEAAEPMLFSEWYLRAHPDVLKGLRAAVGRLPVTALQRLARGALRHDLVDRLGTLRAPTLVLVGEEDLLTPLRHAQALAGQIPGARLVVVPACGHVIPMERPALFNETVVQFLRSHDGLLKLTWVRDNADPIQSAGTA
ncbi:MAG: alpha/beta fold hydrolase [Nitrospirales bacterium]